jgi:hypothetical protein
VQALQRQRDNLGRQACRALPGLRRDRAAVSAALDGAGLIVMLAALLFVVFLILNQ